MFASATVVTVASRLHEPPALPYTNNSWGRARGREGDRRRGGIIFRRRRLLHEPSPSDAIRSIILGGIWGHPAYLGDICRIAALVDVVNAPRRSAPLTWHSRPRSAVERVRTGVFGQDSHHVWRLKRWPQMRVEGTTFFAPPVGSSRHDINLVRDFDAPHMERQTQDAKKPSWGVIENLLDLDRQKFQKRLFHLSDSLCSVHTSIPTSCCSMPSFGDFG